MSGSSRRHLPRFGTARLQEDVCELGLAVSLQRDKNCPTLYRLGSQDGVSAELDKSECFGRLEKLDSEAKKVARTDTG